MGVWSWFENYRAYKVTKEYYTLQPNLAVFSRLLWVLHKGPIIPNCDDGYYSVTLDHNEFQHPMPLSHTQAGMVF